MPTWKISCGPTLNLTNSEFQINVHLFKQGLSTGTAAKGRSVALSLIFVESHPFHSRLLFHRLQSVQCGLGVGCVCFGLVKAYVTQPTAVLPMTWNGTICFGVDFYSKTNQYILLICLVAAEGYKYLYWFKTCSSSDLVNIEF